MDQDQTLLAGPPLVFDDEDYVVAFLEARGFEDVGDGDWWNHATRAVASVRPTDAGWEVHVYGVLTDFGLNEGQIDSLARAVRRGDTTLAAVREELTIAIDYGDPPWVVLNRLGVWS